jgi:predicted metal-dependent hydrolase
MIVILFTTQFPNKVSEALEAEGTEVYEALAISEVLALAEQHPVSSIIITPDVEQTRADVIAKHYPTVRLREGLASQNARLNLINFSRDSPSP